MFGYVSQKMDIEKKLYSKKNTQLASVVRIIARRQDGGGYEISICSVWPVSCSAASSQTVIAVCGERGKALRMADKTTQCAAS